MKFWNRRKEVRQRCWTCVKLHIDKDRHPYWTGSYEGFVTYGELRSIKAELQRSPSKGRFYLTIMKKEVWFQHPKDATWFAIKYSEKLR